MYLESYCYIVDRFINRECSRTRQSTLTPTEHRLLTGGASTEAETFCAAFDIIRC